MGGALIVRLEGGAGMTRTSLTDEQWEAVAPLLPGKVGDRGRSGADNRRSLEGMLWIVRTGAPWRDLPPEFGKWITVYQRFRRWSRAGVFDRIFDSTGGDLDVRSVQVDGSYVKVHQHGTGAPKEGARPTTPDAARPSEDPEAGSPRSSWPSSTGEDASCASP